MELVCQSVADSQTGNMFGFATVLGQAGQFAPDDDSRKRMAEPVGSHPASAASEVAARESERPRTPRWDLRSVEPGPVRIASNPLAPSREVVGVIWEGVPMALDDFLEMAGKAGWEIVAAGNTGERHHRLYLKRQLSAD